MFYIFYQGFLLASTILGPGTILLTVASSFRTVFSSLTLAESYLLAVAPAVFYLIICLKTKPDTQVMIGALMSSVYSMIMTMVLVATIAQFTTSDEISASSFFFIFLVILFFITGLLHPQEMLNLIYGILYLVTLPGGYVLLVIYSICNLHIVSWGTREVATTKRKKSKKKKNGDPNDAKNQTSSSSSPESKTNEKDAKKENKGLLAYIIGGDGKKGALENIAQFLGSVLKPTANRQEQLLLEICNKLENLNENKNKTPLSANETPRNDITANNLTMQTIDPNKSNVGNQTNNTSTSSGDVTADTTNNSQIARNYLYNPFWIEMKSLGKNDIYYLNTKEMTFWQGLIDKYLHPLNKDEAEEKRIAGDLIELRNNSCFAFFMLNALWVVMQFQFEYVSVAFPKLQIPVGNLYNRPDQKVQILGLIFLILFTLVLVLQFLSMLFHRWGTIVEILASTRLFNKHRKYRDTKLTIQEAVDLIKEMELEKQSFPMFDSTGSTNTTTEDDANSTEPDPDYMQGDEEDILPEPEPDYFDHPAVNNIDNWNRRFKSGMTPMPQSNFNHNLSHIQPNPSARYSGRENFSPPYPANQQQDFLQTQLPTNNGFVFSPRTNNLRPLQSLDTKVMRQFRVLEQKDPRFKRRVKQLQYMSNRLASPGGTDIAFNNV